MTCYCDVCTDNIGQLFFWVLFLPSDGLCLLEVITKVNEILPKNDIHKNCLIIQLTICSVHFKKMYTSNTYV